MEAVEKAKEYMKGTTTVGVVSKDGIVFASDRRATMGTLIAHKKVEKILQLDDHIAMTVAGAVSDAQALARWVQAEAKLYKLRKGDEISVEGMATLIGNIMHSMRYYPLFVQLIVGGYDKSGGRIFSVDLLGSILEDKTISTGSGSPVAYGVLEDGFREGMSLDEAENLATRALKAALERDAMTGNGIDIVKITKKGLEKTEL